MPKKQTGETSNELNVVDDVERRVRDVSEGSAQATEYLVPTLTQSGQIGCKRD